MTSEELAERIKAEVLAMVGNGIIPANVGSFAGLHDHVDANGLGGADTMFGAMVTESSTDEEHQAKLDAFSAIHIPACDIVDAWIKSGGITHENR